MLALLLALLARAEDPPEAFPAVRQKLDGGVLDWTTWRLEASASSDRRVGAWKDQRVQEQDALDRLSPLVLALAPTVRVTPEKTAGDLMTGSDELSLRLAEGLATWHVVETRYINIGGVEMDATLDLQSWLRPALVSMAQKGAPPPITGPVTGLLVDVRGLGFEPCMAPSLGAAEGPAVWNASMLSEEAVRRAAPVIYVTDPADPRAYARAGEHPLFLAATAATSSCAIELSPADAATLASTPDLGPLAAAGRLVVVVDP